MGMTTNEHRNQDHQDHQDDCLMCAVRALTSGEPEITWQPETEAQTISGVVLRRGETESYYGPVPYVDLWLGGAARTRVVANPMTLRAALDRAAPKVGDTLTIWFEGWSEPVHGPNRDRRVRVFRAAVRRGH
jgi:hypothetical protein